jgi:adenylate cyclase
VMVGGFSAGMAEDEKTTPYGLMYGVEMHTNTLNTIIMDNFLIYAPDWLDALILAGLVLITALLVGRLKNPIWSLAIVLVALAGYFLAVNLIFYTESYILNYGSVAIAALLTYLSVLGYRALTEGRERARMRAAFSQSVSPAVMEWMLDMQDRGELELGGDDKEITVFFSDIRGFNSMSEGMEPQELLNHLNEYLSAMSEVVTQYNGTLDKYVGDEIMAFWGAPKPQREHAILACKCALKQREVLAELNAGWPEHKRIRIGIGINTGIMTAGLMGSRMKSEYSLTGDNVNLGARLEGINKEYGTMIIVSESTYQLVKDHVIARELDRVMAKGKQKAVTIYELWEMKGPLEPTPEELANE